MLSQESYFKNLSALNHILNVASLQLLLTPKYSLYQPHRLNYVRPHQLQLGLHVGVLRPGTGSHIEALME